MPIGADLIQDVDNCSPPEPGLSFWWLGQNGFILKLADQVVYVDPYLKPDERRRTPPLLKPEQITHADWVLCTHDHSDHLDPTAIPGIVGASPQCRFVAPRTARERMLSLEVPADRLVCLDDGDTHQADKLSITAVKSRHEFFDHVEGLGYPYLGYVVQAGGGALYHAGDGQVYEGLLTTLQRFSLDLAFLPINGRDAPRFRRNILGNMTFQEAVDLAGDLGVALAVPMHYDMFAHNAEDPQKFVDYLGAKYPAVRSWVGPPGERVDFSR